MRNPQFYVFGKIEAHATETLSASQGCEVQNVRRKYLRYEKFRFSKSIT